MSTASRISSAEQRLRVLRPGLRIVTVRGGLQDGIADHAEIDGAQIVREPERADRVSRARPLRTSTNCCR
jgi:hypothetical protein